MRMRIGVVAIRSWALGLLSVGLAACGGGGKTLPPFVQGTVIGPGGGTAETVTVRLIVPGGAFTADLALAILPQPTPLPIDPLAGDVAYMPGIMCIGPVGQPLLVGGRLRMCYSPADIPKGLSETDLVLLEWDDVAGFMRISLDAVQDLVHHCFEDDDYTALGHVAIGVIGSRTTSLFVYQNDSGSAMLRAAGLPAVSTRGLGWVFRNNGIRDDLTVTTIDNTADAEDFLPSIGGQRVLFVTVDSQAERKILHTVDLDPAGGFPSRELSDTTTDSIFDPLFGWLESGDDNVYVERYPLPGPAGGPVTGEFDRIAATGAPPPDTWTYAHPSTNTFLDDVRQSPDGSLTLLRYVEFGQFTLVRYDVVHNDTGTALETDILPSRPDAALPTPRWLPDSSGFYYIDLNGVDVRAIDADGTNNRLLYTIGEVFEEIRDFVVAPDYDGADLANSHCAYVDRDLEITDDSLVIDTLDATAPTLHDLSGAFTVDEMAWRPDGAGIILDLFDNSRALRTTGIIPQATQFLHFADATGAEQRRINATMGDLDVDRDTSEVMLWISSGLQDPAFAADGIYLLGFDDGADVLAVPGSAGVPPTRAVGPARFIHSWRRSPGFNGSDQIR